MEADPGDDGLRSSERSESQNVGEGATLSMVFPEFDLDSPDVQTALDAAANRLYHFFKEEGDFPRELQPNEEEAKSLVEIFLTCGIMQTLQEFIDATQEPLFWTTYFGRGNPTDLVIARDQGVWPINLVFRIPAGIEKLKRSRVLAIWQFCGWVAPELANCSSLNKLYVGSLYGNQTHIEAGQYFPFPPGLKVLNVGRYIGDCCKYVIQSLRCLSPTMSSVATTTFPTSLQVVVFGMDCGNNLNEHDFETMLFDVVPWLPHLRELHVSCHKIESIGNIVKRLRTESNLKFPSGLHTLSMDGNPFFPRYTGIPDEKFATIEQFVDAMPVVSNIGEFKLPPSLSYRLYLNHAGRALLQNKYTTTNNAMSAIPVSLWPHVLARHMETASGFRTMTDGLRKGMDGVCHILRRICERPDFGVHVVLTKPL